MLGRPKRKLTETLYLYCKHNCGSHNLYVLGTKMLMFGVASACWHMKPVWSLWPVCGSYTGRCVVYTGSAWKPQDAIGRRRTLQNAARRCKTPILTKLLHIMAYFIRYCTIESLLATEKFKINIVQNSDLSSLQLYTLRLKILFTSPHWQYYGGARILRSTAAAVDR